MCIYCGDGEDARQAREHAATIADNLRDLAAHYRETARGRGDHHNEKAKLVLYKARAVIRDLVADWV